ncbi:MAG: AmmeMemoRadiSam system protein B [Thermoplasmata archaeon]
MTDAPHRRPAVAGSFYPEDASELTRLLERCFLDPRGPGELPDRHRRESRNIRAAVVPHAGFIYSGPIQAHAYRAIAAERPPESILLLGVNHRGVGAPAALSSVVWDSPLGPLPPEPGLRERLDHPPIETDDSAHRGEHSLEVQLPFLQYVLPHPRAVMLSVRYDRFDALRSVAESVKAAVSGRDVLLIASTDLSHYLPVEEVRALDALAIEQIRKRDARGLYDVVEHRGITMCGVAPTVVLLAALESESLDVRLLAWGHSGQAAPMTTVVGYAALLLESAKAIP